MLKYLLSGLLCLFFAQITYGQLADSTIFIKSSTENYQFVYNPKTTSVEIKEKQIISYISTRFQATVPVALNYNNQVTLTSVNCEVDGHKPRDFKPVYTYYGSDDIFYSDEKICYFPMAIPRKGALGVVTFEQTVNDPRYFTSIYFTEPYAVEQKTVAIKVPRWMKVEFKELNFGTFNIKKSSQYLSGEDADLITYSIQNLPATKQEGNSPGPSYIYPHLLVMCKSAATGGNNFTYFNTLDDQYKWYHSLTKNNTVADQAAVTAKAKELVAGQATDIDKIKTIYYYVQDNIRYIAFEDGMAGFKPESPDEVLRKKYGDCKGMANLTKALLTASGYDARLCWLGTNHIAYDYQTPSLSVDNHMICAIDLKGKTYFLDATESYIGFDEYAERIQGRQVLMEDGDKYKLTRVPVAAMGQNANNSTAKFEIVDGTLKGTVNYIWKGEDKEAVLAGINSIRREKATDAMKNYLAGDNNDYTITNLTISQMERPEGNLSASYQVSTKNGISAFGKSLYLDLDHTREFAEGTIKADERKHDYWFSHKMDIKREAELLIPTGFKVDYLPAALNIITPEYEFHIQYTAMPTKVIYKKNILIKNTHLAKAKFGQWNQDIEQLLKAYNDTITLKPL